MPTSLPVANHILILIRFPDAAKGHLCGMRKRHGNEDIKSCMRERWKAKILLQAVAAYRLRRKVSNPFVNSNLNRTIVLSNLASSSGDPALVQQARCQHKNIYKKSEMSECQNLCTKKKELHEACWSRFWLFA